MAYGGFKDLARRITSDKKLRDKANNIANNQNMIDIKRVLHQWFINFWIKALLGAVLKIKLFPIKNYQKNYTNLLLENLRKEKNTRLL